jgi:hypothetical protein
MDCVRESPLQRTSSAQGTFHCCDNSGSHTPCRTSGWRRNTRNTASGTWTPCTYSHEIPRAVVSEAEGLEQSAAAVVGYARARAKDHDAVDATPVENTADVDAPGVAGVAQLPTVAVADSTRASLVVRYGVAASAGSGLGLAIDESGRSG